MKKLFTIATCVATIAATLLVSAPVHATPTQVLPNTPNGGLLTPSPITGDHGNSTLEVTPIGGDYYQGTAYSRSFVTNKENGKQLNLFVQNNTSAKINLHVDTSGNNAGGYGYDYEIPANGSATKTWANDFGISGTWSVYITNDSGAKMNLYVRARQF